MKTDDLIRGLVADQATQERPPASALAPWFFGGLLVSLAIFFAVLGFRPDLSQALATVRFVLKPVEMLLFAGAAGWLAVRLATPGTSLRPPLGLLLAAVALLVAAVLGELLAVPTSAWMPRLVGSSAGVCVAAVPLLAAPLLTATLVALRHGAPLRPALAGAVAGLFSAAAAAALYALHCRDDSPLFVGTWYTLAAALTAAAGAALGRKLLRW